MHKMFNKLNNAEKWQFMSINNVEKWYLLI